MYAQDNNSLPVWIILSPAYHHISINSPPFLVGIVSPSISVVVFEMYSLIGSLVVMHVREAGVLVGTFIHALRFKCGRFRRQTGLHMVQKRFTRVSVTCTFEHVLRVSSCLVAMSTLQMVLRVIQAW